MKILKTSHKVATPKQKSPLNGVHILATFQLPASVEMLPYLG